MADKLPTPKLQPGPRTAVRPDRKGYGVGRSARRSEEDTPSRDYVARIEELGPRDGESLLAFTKRVGAIRAGRKFVIETWRQNPGKARVSIALGIPRNTLAHELRTIGLSDDLLDAGGIDE